MEPDVLLQRLHERVGLNHVRHGIDGTLATHLKGVWRILRSWRLPDDVSVAGLFHSVYGTESFTNAVLRDDQRPLVRDLVGPEAERLAFLFGRVSHRDLFDGSDASRARAANVNGGHPLSREDRLALLHMLAANMIDQFSSATLRNRVALSALEALWRSCSDELCARAQADLRATFQRAHLPRFVWQSYLWLTVKLNFASALR